MLPSWLARLSAIVVGDCGDPVQALGGGFIVWQRRRRVVCVRGVVVTGLRLWRSAVEVAEGGYLDKGQVGGSPVVGDRARLIVCLLFTGVLNHR